MIKPYLKKLVKESIKGRISFDEHLKDHTTFRIGGIPHVWVEPDSLEDLRRALRIFSKIRLEVMVIGNGSNILANDGRIKKALIKLSSPYFKRITFGDNSCICGSGCALSFVIKRCIKRGLSGLEALAGIPGTVGGAIAVNAGGDKRNNIGDAVEWIRVIDYRGNRITLLKRIELNFNYRDSNLSRYIILEAKFALKRCTPNLVQRKFSRFLKRKIGRQEYRFPNAGCVFKNPRNSNLTSAQIIELCGLKGIKINDAEVSTKHANFIINKGSARFKDIIALIKLEQRIVNENSGLWLEPEIRIIR